MPEGITHAASASDGGQSGKIGAGGNPPLRPGAKTKTPYYGVLKAPAVDAAPFLSLDRHGAAGPRDEGNAVRRDKAGEAKTPYYGVWKRGLNM